MPLASDLQRNESGFFFSREVPVDLRGFIAEPRIIRDLATSDIEEARRRCWTVALHVDRLFDSLRLESSRLSTEAQRFLWRWRLMPVGTLSREWADTWFGAKLAADTPPQLYSPPVAESPFADIQPTSAPASKAAVRSATLSFVFEGWKQEYVPTRTHPHRYVIPVRRFIEFHGDGPIEDVKPPDVWRFLEALTKMPARAMRGTLRGSMPTILQHPDAAGKPKMSALTQAHYRTVVSMYFQWAVAYGHLNENPVDKLLKRPRRPIYEPRQPFDGNDLKRIFSAPVYTGARSVNQRMVRGDFILRDFIFWMPLLALFTGARLSELAYLLPGDVGEENGIPYVHIHLNESGRNLKTQASIRKIPVHPMLVRCGFLRFVDSRRGQGDALLFDEIKMYGGISRVRVTHKLNEVIRSAGITDPRKTFNSFRHTFKRACRTAAIAEEVHDALTGHAPRTTGRRYGMYYPIEMLDTAMKRIEFPGLDLRHLMKQ